MQNSDQPCNLLLTIDPCSVKSALQGIYKDPSRVDDALVESICSAAEREGAFRTFVKIITGPAGMHVILVRP